MTENTVCVDNCSCKTADNKGCSCIELISKLKEERDAANDKYLRLYAEFENWKKRSIKDKEDAIESTKVKTLDGVLTLNDDLHFAKLEIDKITDESVKTGLNLILNKLNKFVTTHGVSEIQTDEYDSDLHEVVSVLSIGEDKIVEVLSKGYTLNGRVIRYPKIVLGKK